MSTYMGLTNKRVFLDNGKKQEMGILQLQFLDTGKKQGMGILQLQLYLTT